MEVVVVPPKREYPKFLWGPDGRQARFDSPADIPRDYFPTLEEALAYAAGKPIVKEAPPATEPVALSADAQELEEFRKWKARSANMAKARAARKKKADTVETGV